MSNLPGAKLPGRTQPDLRTLDGPMPGIATQKSGRVVSASVAGVALDETGVTEVGTVEGDSITDASVTLSEDPGDVTYEVRVSPTVGVGPATVEFEVTDPSATAGTTADVTVDAIAERDL